MSDCVFSVKSMRGIFALIDYGTMTFHCSRSNESKASSDAIHVTNAVAHLVTPLILTDKEYRNIKKEEQKPHRMLLKRKASEAKLGGDPSTPVKVVKTKSTKSDTDRANYHEIDG
jgi:hypothetical protein